jgi:cytidylate kinase
MPVIFISRGTMSGVHNIVDCLKERIGVRCISVEDLVKIVNQHGEIATRIVNKLARATSAYTQFSELRWPYIVLLRQAMLEEIRHDNMIYHGYSSHLILPYIRHFVRVRIEAPLEMRVTMTKKRIQVNEEKAREYIQEKDEYRVKWARFMYAQDIRNPMLYDLVINMGHMTLEAACGIVADLMTEADFQATPESQSIVNDLYLTTSVEEALVTDTRTALFEIRAKVEDERTIHLIGPYLEEAELATVTEVAKSVPGVVDVCYTPGYAPMFEIRTQPN